MKRRNGYRRIRELMAGGRRKYYELTFPERVRISRIARDMYDNGIDYVTAANARKTEKRGFVYIITHPAFPEYVKIGRAFDPESRLRGYQTGCPQRAYRLYHAVYFNDCIMAEREIHARIEQFRDTQAEGEWFKCFALWAANQIDALREVL